VSLGLGVLGSQPKQAVDELDLGLDSTCLNLPLPVIEVFDWSKLAPLGQLALSLWLIHAGTPGYYLPNPPPGTGTSTPL
jgi:hypothetical protein